MRRWGVKVSGRSYRTIWLNADGWGVDVIDQRWLPHEFRIATLSNVGDAATAIRDMWVRGAPLIGVTAAYGVALAMRRDVTDAFLCEAAERLRATRPTAVNLNWALARMLAFLGRMPEELRRDAALVMAKKMAADDIACNEAIGEHGLQLIRAAQEKRGGAPVRILTHCNAGWLATVDWGTATAPIYKAQAAGIALHVFVDETRPRNQGASLTAFELGQQNVPYTLIVDNAGGHLMQHGEVDLVLVGADRIAANGDACNKIGTYLKALAAKDCGVPFYVAAPVSTFDFSLTEGRLIPIEERAQEEVTYISGAAANGEVVT